MRSRRIAAGFVSAVLVVAAPGSPGSASGDDAKAEAQEKARALPGDDALRKVLADAAEALRSAEKKGAAGGMTDFRAFAMRLAPEDKADAFRAIAAAQARVGDAEGASRTWQDAVDAADEARDADARASALCAIAESRAESSDRADVLALLQQAIQAARRIKDDPDEPQILRQVDGDVGEKRSGVLVRIAVAQARAGDVAASGKALRLAEEAAGSIEAPIRRADALAAIAGATEPGMSRQAWSKALQYASTLADPWLAGRSTEAVLLARVRSGGYDEALAMIGDGLKGDLASYALWVVADAMAKADGPASAGSMKRLLEMAEASAFDRPTKRSKVFGRIAAAMADAGDAEGAERVIGKLAEDPDRHFSFLMARAGVLSRLGKAQLKAGHKDAAKVTLRVALDIAAPSRGGDGPSLFPLREIAETLARAGEVASAIETAEAIPDATLRAPALAAVAVIRAESGDRPGADATLARATRAADAIPNETLWTMGTVMDNPWAIDHLSTFKATALEAIAVARAKAGDLPGALKALAGEGGTARKPASANATEQIALIQAKAGDYPGALKTVEALAGDEPLADQAKSTALAKIARLQALSGDPTAVLGWATKQTFPRVKADILKSLAEAITEARGPRKPPGPPANP